MCHIPSAIKHLASGLKNQKQLYHLSISASNKETAANDSPSFFSEPITKLLVGS